VKIDIQTDVPINDGCPKIGNVYPVRGGRAMRYGCVYVVVAIRQPMDDYDGCSVICLMVNRDGAIVGSANYAMQYFAEKAPIAFVDGLEELHLTMRSL
jgi:hypothetical protein